MVSDAEFARAVFDRTEAARSRMFDAESEISKFEGHIKELRDDAPSVATYQKKIGEKRQEQAEVERELVADLRKMEAERVSELDAFIAIDGDKLSGDDVAVLKLAGLTSRDLRHIVERSHGNLAIRRLCDTYAQEHDVRDYEPTSFFEVRKVEDSIQRTSDLVNMGLHFIEKWGRDPHGGYILQKYYGLA